MLDCCFQQIPCTNDLLGTSGMQLALLVQPLALPHPSEDPIQVIYRFFLFLFWYWNGIKLMGFTFVLEWYKIFTANYLNWNQWEVTLGFKLVNMYHFADDIIYLSYCKIPELLTCDPFSFVQSPTCSASSGFYIITVARVIILDLTEKKDVTSIKKIFVSLCSITSSSLWASCLSDEETHLFC